MTVLRPETSMNRPESSCAGSGEVNKLDHRLRHRTFTFADNNAVGERRPRRRCLYANHDDDIHFIASNRRGTTHHRDGYYQQ